MNHMLCLRPLPTFPLTPTCRINFPWCSSLVFIQPITATLILNLSLFNYRLLHIRSIINTLPPY